jgi:prepilin-type N-terminal cleavage/methylation domain-containing protein
MKTPTVKPSGEAAYTLIEMMVVVIVITVLTAMAIANYIRMEEHAKMASCLSNQRNIHQAMTIFASEHEVPDGEVGVEVFLLDRAVPRALCECPSSNDGSYDDYTVVWLGGVPRDVRCDVEGDKHLWGPR